MAIPTVHRKAGSANGSSSSVEAWLPRPARLLRKGCWRSEASHSVASATADGWPRSEDGEAASEIILTNVRVVTRDAMFRGTVQVVGGRIAAIDTGRSALPSASDLEGDYLIPGLVDIHTDNLERHLEPRPGVAWPSFAALVTHDRQVAAAGVTTVFDSLCVGDQQRGGARRQGALDDSVRAMQRAQADGLLKSEHFLHLRCEVSADEVVETFAALAGDPLVRLVSLMDHTPGQRQWSNLDKWRQFNQRSEISEAELQAIYERRTRVQAGVIAAGRREVARICHEQGLALASHDDTTPEHVAQAAAEGVTISEFPTTIDAARLASANGMQVVMGAPNVVLGGSHSGNVSARELAVEDLIDGLASDYVPVSLIQACFLFHEALGMDLPRAVAKVTANPAAMIGLSDRGEIAPDARADLVWVKAYDHMPVIRGVWREGQRVV